MSDIILCFVIHKISWNPVEWKLMLFAVWLMRKISHEYKLTNWKTLGNILKEASQYTIILFVASWLRKIFSEITCLVHVAGRIYACIFHTYEPQIKRQMNIEHYFIPILTVIFIISSRYFTSFAVSLKLFLDSFTLYMKYYHLIYQITHIVLLVTLPLIDQDSFIFWGTNKFSLRI